MNTEVSPNLIDKIVTWVSPVAGAKRLKARFAISGALRAYEGAAMGRRTDGWRTASTSANAEIGVASDRLRQRARDLVRNNTYAAKGIQVICSNVVGTGIMARPIAAKQGQEKRLMADWKAWASSLSCDFEGRKDFYGIQKLALRSAAEGGDMLLRRRFTNKRLEIQCLEADFLDSTKDGEQLTNGNYIVQGIEFTPENKRAAYWLWPIHPGDVRKNAKLQSVRVPAEDIIHIFREDRIGQARGVTWLAPCIIRMRDFDEYEDAQLVRQKIAAAFVGFVKDITGPETSTGLGSGTPGTPEKIEPGAFEILPPGKEVQFSNPPGVDGYRDFSDISLHAIAAGLGITYESLTGDLKGVNYSSGRMGWIEFSRNIEDWQWNMLIPHLCNGVFKWFSDWNELVTGVKCLGAEWTPPRRTMLDPSKEYQGMITAIRGGLLTLSEALRGQGYEPKEVFAEWAEDAKLLNELGLIFDSDPRKVMKAGMFQAELPPEEPKAEEQ